MAIRSNCAFNSLEFNAVSSWPSILTIFDRFIIQISFFFNFGFSPCFVHHFGFFFLSVLTFALHFRNFNANYDNNSKIKKKERKRITRITQTDITRGGCERNAFRSNPLSPQRKKQTNKQKKKERRISLEQLHCRLLESLPIFHLRIHPFLVPLLILR